MSEHIDPIDRYRVLLRENGSLQQLLRRYVYCELSISDEHAVEEGTVPEDRLAAVVSRLVRVLDILSDDIAAIRKAHLK